MFPSVVARFVSFFFFLIDDSVLNAKCMGYSNRLKNQDHVGHLRDQQKGSQRIPAICFVLLGKEPGTELHPFWGPLSSAAPEPRTTVVCNDRWQITEGPRGAFCFLLTGLFIEPFKKSFLSPKFMVSEYCWVEAIIRNERNSGSTVTQSLAFFL